MKNIAIAMAEIGRQIGEIFSLILVAALLAIATLVALATGWRRRKKGPFLKAATILVAPGIWVTSPGDRKYGSPSWDPEAWLKARNFRTEPMGDGATWFATADRDRTLVLSVGTAASETSSWKLAILEMDGPVPRGVKLFRLRREVVRAAREIQGLEKEVLVLRDPTGTEVPVTHEALGALVESYNSDEYHGGVSGLIQAAT